MILGWGQPLWLAMTRRGGVGVDTDARVERLLDKLEDPNLTDHEIEQVQKKIEFLKELQS